MDARCQMQERGERERRVMSRGHRHQMPQHTTLWLMATGRREKLIKMGFQTLTDDNISVCPALALISLLPGLSDTICKIFFSRRLVLTHRRRCEIVFIIRVKDFKDQTRLWCECTFMCRLFALGLTGDHLILDGVISKSSSVDGSKSSKKAWLNFIRPRLICERRKGSLDDSVKPPPCSYQ